MNIRKYMHTLLPVRSDMNNRSWGYSTTELHLKHFEIPNILLEYEDNAF